MKLKFYEVGQRKIALAKSLFYKVSAKLRPPTRARSCCETQFSIVDHRKVALVNELRNYRTVTSKVNSFKYSIPLQLNGGSEKHSKPLYHQAIIKKTRGRARGCF